MLETTFCLSLAENISLPQAKNRASGQQLALAKAGKITGWL